MWVDAERAGHSTIVVGESSLDGLVARLSGASIDHPDPQQATTSRILPLVDPDGNRVVFTESPMASSADEIRGIGRLVIREGKRNEFEHLVARAVEVVRKKDPGTIEYSVYLDADGAEAIVHERYRDSAAGLAHSENLAVLMPAFLDAATISGEVCGSPSPELREALEAAGVKIYTPLRSM